jgi:hypothetical protein
MVVDSILDRRSEEITMKRTRALTGVVVVTMLFGLVSIAAARDWDQYYGQRPNNQGDFTNSQAWSATIVALGPDWFDVVRYGETIRLRVKEGSPRLFLGERVRMVPFARDDGAEIAELRLPDQDFRPVGVVRYIERNVPKEGPVYNGSGGSQYSFSFHVETGRTGIRYNPPVQPRTPAFRQPPVRNNGHWAPRR